MRTMALLDTRLEENSSRSFLILPKRPSNLARGTTLLPNSEFRSLESTTNGSKVVILGSSTRPMRKLRIHFLVSSLLFVLSRTFTTKSFKSGLVPTNGYSTRAFRIHVPAASLSTNKNSMLFSGSVPSTSMAPSLEAQQRRFFSTCTQFSTQERERSSVASVTTDIHRYMSLSIFLMYVSRTTAVAVVVVVAAAAAASSSSSFVLVSKRCTMAETCSMNVFARAAGMSKSLLLHHFSQQGIWNTLSLTR